MDRTVRELDEAIYMDKFQQQLLFQMCIQVTSMKAISWVQEINFS